MRNDIVAEIESQKNVLLYLMGCNPDLNKQVDTVERLEFELAKIEVELRYQKELLNYMVAKENDPIINEQTVYIESLEKAYEKDHENADVLHKFYTYVEDTYDAMEFTLDEFNRKLAEKERHRKRRECRKAENEKHLRMIAERRARHA